MIIKMEYWILNQIDNCPNKYNSNQKDSEKAGVGDACDNCLNIQNTNQKDDNKDGIWDICQDIDSDWFTWYIDNCPYEKILIKKTIITTISR